MLCDDIFRQSMGPVYWSQFRIYNSPGRIDGNFTNCTIVVLRRIFRDLKKNQNKQQQKNNNKPQKTAQLFVTSYKVTFGQFKSLQFLHFTLNRKKIEM